jgi:hypothetical protein
MILISDEFLEERMPGLTARFAERYGYRLADMVELQDVVIHAYDYEMDFNGWTELPEWTVHMDVEGEESRFTVDQSKTEVGDGNLNNLQATQKISAILVRDPLQPGFLDMLVGFMYTEGLEEKIHVKAITYSGNYTIWWHDF